MEYPSSEAFTYGVTIGGGVAALLTLAVAVGGGALLGRLFLRRDRR